MQEIDPHLSPPPPYPWWRASLQFALIVYAPVLLLTRPYLVEAVRDEKYASEWLLFGPFLFLVLFLVLLGFEVGSKKNLPFSFSDYIHAAFGLLVIALLFPASIREYRVRNLPDPVSFALIEKFSDHKDASIRALAVLASSRHKMHNAALRALIQKSLIDKDPLVRQAAKLVIEDNFGIRLKNGAEGIHQAQSFITDDASSALLMRKGSP